MQDIDVNDLFPDSMQPEEVALREGGLPDKKSQLMDEFNPDEWMKASEVADLFRVDASTVKRWVKTGKMDKVRTFSTPGGHARFSRVDINKLMMDSNHADRS